MACNPSKIIAALHFEKETVKDIVYERINQSKKTVLAKIPDGGVVERSSNQDSIIYGEAHQASMAYRKKDNTGKPLEAGQMAARKQTGANGLFDTNIQEIDDNACHGFCTIEFGQGFRRRTTQDFDLDLDTPVKCARELDGQGPEHIKGYFEGFRRQFTKFGMDNFGDNLLNNVIEYGEANASIVAADQFVATSGGWQAPPKFRLSIHFLKDYRDHIMAETEALAMDMPEDWKLEIEAPRDDWFEAVTQHNLQRHSQIGASGADLTRFQIGILDDPEHPLKGREFHDYGCVRCFFNESPVRGFYRETGVDGLGNKTYSFVRVYKFVNEAGEEGGLVPKPNHQYRQDKIQVEGAWYDMCTLIPHIHPKSFKRYGLVKPRKPMGEANLGVNYNVEVADGAYLPNNKQNDKFQLIARHEYRLKMLYPELSGMIAYRHSQELGYTVGVESRNYTDPTLEPASPEDYRSCDLIDPVTQENCAECGEVPQSDGQCEVAGSIADSEVGVVPTSAFTTYSGAATTVRIAVTRTGELGNASTVDYTVEESAVQSAIAGTHFTAVSATTLSWAAGDASTRYIDVAILDGSGDVDDDLTFEVKLASPVDSAIRTGAGVSVITIEDLT